MVGESYKNWKPKDNVIIKAQTGTGKNYFVSNILLRDIGDKEKILYMCNRKALKTQTKIDFYNIQGLKVPMLANGSYDFDKINKTIKIGKVEIRTYQSICLDEHARNYEDHDISHEQLNFSSYKYCIFDEIHYILNDSFSGMTDIMFSKMKKPDNTIKVFMSATIGVIENSINRMSEETKAKCHIYNQPIDYSYIKPYVFDEIEDIVRLIKNDKTDDKWLVFVRKIEESKPFIKILGKENVTFVRSGKIELINQIALTSTFETKVLVTTCVLDNGVNFKDEKIKHLVTTEFDKTKFIQEVGRIRFKDCGSEGVYASDVNLYIPRLDDLRIYRSLISKCNYYESIVEDRDGWVSDDKFGAKYDRDSQKLPKSLFYNTKDKKYVINVIGYASLLAEKTMYIKMSGMLQKEDSVNGKKNSIVNLRLDWLGLPRNQFEEISEIVEDTTVMMINDYLEDLFVNKVVFLTKKDRTELIETINLIDYHNSCKSKNIIKYVQNIETLNKYIRDTLELPYEIKCFETSRMIEGKKMKYKNAWKVVKIIG